MQRPVRGRRQPGQLFGQCGLDVVDQRWAGGDDNGQGLWIVLGLGEHVGGDESGISRVIGDDQHLAGSGEHVDAHPAHDLTLGLGNVLIARTDDDIHRRDGFGAVGQGGDGPGGTNLIDLIDTDLAGRDQQGRADPALGIGRRDHHPSGDSSDLGGDTVHQHRGNQGR
jgi:hypothetical protein